MEIGIVTVIKNEHLYLKEWIDYHLSIGVNHIYIFEDFDSDSHSGITSQYSECVRLIPLDSIKEIFVNIWDRQFETFKYASKTVATECDWCAFIDADEFITITTDESLEEILSDYKEFPAVICNWVNYGASGQLYYEDKPVIERFQKECRFQRSDMSWRFKSICNMNYQINSRLLNLHQAKGGVDTLKNVHKQNSYTRYRLIIRHYYTKSFEEWIYKVFVRGDAYQGNRKYFNFFESNPDMSQYCTQNLDTIFKRNTLLKSLNNINIVNDRFMTNTRRPTKLESRRIIKKKITHS